MLVDPCDPPDSLEPAELIDQEYAIGDIDQFYTHPDFVVTSTPADMCDVALIKYTYAETFFKDAAGTNQDAIDFKDDNKQEYFWPTEKEADAVGKT